MKINRRTVNALIMVLIIATLLSLIFCLCKFTIGTIKRDVASVHITSVDGTIDSYTEDARQCKFLELYFDTFVASQEAPIYGEREKIDTSKFPLKINIVTNGGFEYSILLQENQYDIVRTSLNDIDENKRTKDIPTMSYLKTEGNINYFTIDGVSDDVLSAFITSIRNDITYN